MSSGKPRDDNISQGMHLIIHLKSQLEGFLLNWGQVGMMDGNMQCNLGYRFGLEM